MGVTLTVGVGEALGIAVVSTGLGGVEEGSGVAGEVDASIVGFTVCTGLGASVVVVGDADGEGETVTRG